jgi:hypothetical protein
MSDARFHHDTLSSTRSCPRLDLSQDKHPTDSRYVRNNEAGSDDRTTSYHLILFAKDDNRSLGKRDHRRFYWVGSEHLSTLLPTAELNEQASQRISMLGGDPHRTQRCRSVSVCEVLRSVCWGPVIANHEQVGELRRLQFRGLAI